MIDTTADGRAVSDKPKVTLLTPFVDVRRGEVAPLFASMLWIFLALTAYYIIKPLRSAVLQERIGVDDKWIALIATTVFVAVLAYLYGRIVPHVARARLILSTFCIFILCLALFAIALPTGSSLIGYAFFVWVSTFNLMIVSQFWSLAADVWTKEEGIRLFGFVGVGGVAGGIFGTLVVAGFAKTLSTRQMLFLSAAVLLVCMLLALYILRFGATRSAVPPGSAPVPKAIEPAPVNSIMLVLGSPYLRLIAAMMLILNLVNTNNEWILDKVVSRAHMDHAALKEFYAQFYLVQNVLTFGIQFFLTARIQRRFGAAVALYFEPIIGIVGGVAFMVAPLLAVIRWHKVLENATDYSIQSNTKELLYLPVSKIEKYSAKNFNDTFVVRGGDALGAATIFLATTVLLPAFGDLGLSAMIGIDVLLGITWLVIASAIGRMHRNQMKTLTGQ
jgi:ATP:ADP antiporter, AAA family